MSDEVKDGGPAFPTEGYSFEEDMDIVHPGMSLRDWFAGQALPQAILDYDRQTRTGPAQGDYVLPYTTKAIGTREDIIARQAYRYADALLTARQKDENNGR